MMIPFQFVVVTFPDEKAARSASKGPLEKLRQSYPCTRILASCDPYNCRVGSGGGTLNALEEVLVELEKDDNDNDNDTRKDEAVAKSVSFPSILILHAGGASSRCPSQMVLGKAWTSIPCSQPTRMLQNPLLLWFRLLQNLFNGLSPGSIVVIASDTILDIPQTADAATKGFSSNEEDTSRELLNWKSLEQSLSVVALSVPAPLNVAKNHGVFVPNENNQQTLFKQKAMSPCLEVFQKPTLDVLKEKCAFIRDDDNSQPAAWIDTGVICFLPKAAQALRNLLIEKTSCQAIRCTKRGLQQLWENTQDSTDCISLEEFSKDSALSIDLYTHFLNALRHSLPSPSSSASVLNLTAFREKYAGELTYDVSTLIYNALSHIELIVWTEPNGSFLHLGTTRELIQFLVAAAEQHASQNSSHATESDDPRSKVVSRLGVVPHLNSVVMNIGGEESGVQAFPACSIICESFLLAKKGIHLAKNCVVEHTFLLEEEGQISVGEGCLVSGLRSKKSINKFGLIVPNNIMVQEIALTSGNLVYMVLGVDDDIKTRDSIYSRPIEEFLKFAGLNIEDLWFDSNHSIIWHAKIHPICPGRDGGNDAAYMSHFSWLESFCHGKELGKDDESLERWKRRERLSLADIRQMAHAPTEFEYRARLSSCLLRGIGDGYISSQYYSLSAAFQEQEDWLFSLRHVLLTRQNKAIEFSCLIPSSFIGRDSHLLTLCIDAFRAIDEIIVDSFEGSSFDICGRAFQLQNAIMEDLSRAHWTEPSDYNELERQLIQQITRLSGRSHAIFSEAHKGIDILCERLCEEMQRITGSISDVVDQFAVMREMILRTHPRLLSPSLTTASEEFARMMTKLCVVGHKKTSLFSTHSYDQLILDRWILATAPARIDLAGGWSDTPPICYEYGSSVTGLAVTIDNKRPLACRTRLIEGSSGILLKSEHRDSNGDLLSSEHVDLHSVDHMKGYNVPSSTCSLLKCALVTLGLVTVDQISDTKAGEVQLSSVVANRCSFDGSLALQVIVTSILPHGSGMGSSSILAGCILASIGMCLGVQLGRTDLMHLVIDLEQELSTGGGPQDQVNGLVGGAKMFSCKPLLFPLALSIDPIELSPSFQRQLDENLVLVYTGQTRLAKNILQTCLRRWATRSTAIVENVEGLIRNAHDAKKCLLSSSLSELGHVLSRYWKQKKFMAGEESGVEPELVSRVCHGLLDRGMIHGGSLCGAGGGGFLVLLKSEKIPMPDLLQELHELVGHDHTISSHSCTVSSDGLTVISIPDSDTFDADYFDITWLEA